jgi:hypothetical protein
MRSLAVVVLVVLTSSARAEVPAPHRYLLGGQLALGAAALDDLEFAQSASASAGLRLIAGLYGVARLRHASPVRGSLLADLVAGALAGAASDGSVDPYAEPERRRHQTELSIGLRYAARWWWAETIVGGQLRYEVGGRSDSDALWTYDATLGVWLTEPQAGVDSFRLGLFGSASLEAHNGAFSRGLVGLELTADVL